MADEGFKRKLAAILSADVEGYGRLMDDDEEATVRTLTAYRTAIADLVQKFRGRIVDTPGDNILAEFISVVDSVNCAVEIQRELAERNAELPDNRRMEFRIGVNLGDVIEEEGRIYGDGVNIAARVESLAEAGGICISGRAHDQVENKLDLEYEDLGKHEVKNISRPIQVHRVLPYPGAAAHRVTRAKENLGRKWRKIILSAAGIVVFVVLLGLWLTYTHRPFVEPASVEKMAFPLPDKPSIAVLPFDNMSGETEQDYIADGFTESIITALSQVPEMFVIARNSVFTYKGKPVKIKQVSEELGVRYVLEGSIQKAGERLRVNAQLIDALKGHHLWAERFDRELKDLFDLQDELTLKILTALQVKLVYSGEGAWKVWNRTNSFEAWSHFSKGLIHFDRVTKQDNRRAQEYFEQATKLDPDYAMAWIMLAYTHNLEGNMGWSESPADSVKRAFEILQKASGSPDYDVFLHSFKSRRYLYQGEWEKSVAEAKKAVEFYPNSSRFHILLADSLVSAGRPEEAIVHAKKAIRFEPIYPAWFLTSLAASYTMLERYEEAIEVRKQQLRRALKGEYPPFWSHRSLVVCYAALDQMDEARAHVAEVLKIDPSYNAETFRKDLRVYKDRAYVDRLVELIIKAGLPENPPLKLPDKPSIAVLSFDNLSGDPEQEYFSDGISEEIISALSKTDQLFVIARNSSFTYKGKPVNVKQVSRELGVRYVLEGSVRKTEDRVRITAQLIDATTGHHLWSERYDRELKDIFALQDEITMKIVTSLQVKLTEGQQARMMAKGYETLDVFLKAMEMLSLWREGTVESHMRHGQIAQEVIDMAPELSVGYRSLGWHHWFLAIIGKSPRENLKKAYELAQTAISKDESDALSHSLLGGVYQRMKQFEKAIAEGERAIELDPNGAQVHLGLGQTLTFAGRPDEAMPYLKQAIRLNPFPPYLYFSNLGRCYLLKGQYEKALTAFMKAVQLAPGSPPPHFNLAVIYILLDREQEARASAKKALELFPNFSVTFISKTSRYKNQAHTQLIIDAMRKAGFPE